MTDDCLHKFVVNFSLRKIFQKTENTSFLSPVCSHIRTESDSILRRENKGQRNFLFQVVFTHLLLIGKLRIAQVINELSIS